MQELDENTFSSATATGTVLIDFSAEWCGPCKAIMPLMQKFSNEFSGRVAVYSVDIDKSPSLAARLGVMSVPTLLLMKGGVQVERMVGAVSERDLRKKVEPHLGAA